jgi:hypothetical protein
MVELRKFTRREEYLREREALAALLRKPVRSRGV